MTTRPLATLAGKEPKQRRDKKQASGRHGPTRPRRLPAGPDPLRAVASVGFETTEMLVPYLADKPRPCTSNPLDSKSDFACDVASS